MGRKCKESTKKKISKANSNTEKDFWKKVNVRSDNECWEWMGRVRDDGYGQFDFERKEKFSHRLAYEFTYGKIPLTNEICHSCDNRRCCNPKHLFTGTHKDNMNDMKQKGRSFHPIGENYGGHKLTNCDVLEIRNLYETGLYSYNDIGKKYHVTRNNIYHIVNRNTWRHI